MPKSFGTVLNFGRRSQVVIIQGIGDVMSLSSTCPEFQYAMNVLNLKNGSKRTVNRLLTKSLSATFLQNSPIPLLIFRQQ